MPSIQQNTGDNNAIGAAEVLRGHLGNTDEINQAATAHAITSGQTGEDGGPLTDDGSHRSNRITRSLSDLEGVVIIQQNNGDGNAMSAATAITGVSGGVGKANQEISADGVTDNMDIDHEGGSRENVIDGSFANIYGRATVQQNNGSGNALNAATALPYNDGGNEGVQQTVTASGTVDDSRAVDEGDTRTNTIADRSFKDMQGVATVQQNNGDGNVLTSAIGLAVNDGSGSLTPAHQVVTASGSVEDARAHESGDVSRVNIVESQSFDNAAGVITVQQNNGHNNVLGASMGLIANIFDGDSSHANAVGSASVNAKIRDNEAYGGGGQRSNSLDTAFVGAQGVMAVQQNTGDNNVILTSLQIVGSNVSIDPFGPASSVAELNTTVTGNLATMSGNENLSEYVNRTSDVANGGGGVFVIQQNTGGNTGMGSAISLVVNGPAISFAR